MNQYLTFTCEDPLGGRPNVFSSRAPQEYPGTKGAFVKVQASKPGILAVCDVSVTVADVITAELQAELDAQKAVCVGYWAQCRASFAGQEAKENLYNCLEVFGFNKTAEYCL